MNTQSLLIKIVLAAVSALALVGCGEPVHKMPEQITFSSEHTGINDSGYACNVQWTSTSKEKYCQVLNDETLNKGCAVESRRATFEAIHCLGEFNAKIQVDFQPTAFIGPDLQLAQGNLSELAKTQTLQSGPLVKTYSYSYTGIEDGQLCSTGLKIVQSHAALCGLLLDDKANNDCASLEREQYYNRSCR